MKVYVNTKEFDMTPEELEFTKNLFGSWDEKDGVYHFDNRRFYTVNELIELVGITKGGIHFRHKRHPERYPLHKNRNFAYIWEEELPKWLNTNAPKDEQENAD